MGRQETTATPAQGNALPKNELMLQQLNPVFHKPGEWRSLQGTQKGQGLKFSAIVTSTTMALQGPGGTSSYYKPEAARLISLHYLPLVYNKLILNQNR